MKTENFNGYPFTMFGMKFISDINGYSGVRVENFDGIPPECQIREIGKDNDIPETYCAVTILKNTDRANKKYQFVDDGGNTAAYAAKKLVNNFPKTRGIVYYANPGKITHPIIITNKGEILGVVCQIRVKKGEVE